MNRDSYDTFWMIFMQGTVEGSSVIKSHTVRHASHEAAKKTAAKLVGEMQCEKATVVQCLPLESVYRTMELVWEVGDES